MSLLNHPLVKSWMAVQRNHAVKVEPEKEPTEHKTVTPPLVKSFKL